MTKGLVFWVLMLIWLVFGVAWSWRGAAFGDWGWRGHGLLVFALFVLLGWAAFGPPIH
jgi:hypothetical protein